VIPGNDDALRAIRLFTSKISESIAEGVHSRDDKNAADIQAVAEAAPAVEAPAAEELVAEPAVVDGAPAAPAAGPEGASPEGEEIRMEDVLARERVSVLPPPPKTSTNYRLKRAGSSKTQVSRFQGCKVSRLQP